MTTEAFTPPPRYTISGTGPYNIPHEYRHAIDFAPVVRSANTLVELTPADYLVAPDTSTTQGDLTLTVAAAAIYDGYFLYIVRTTADEQGWVGVAGAREKGLEQQLDILAMAIQDARRRSEKTLLIEDGPPGGVPTVLEADRALMVTSTGDGLIPGPTANEIANAQTHAERSEGAAANAALGTPYGFETAIALKLDDRLSYTAGENSVVVAVGQYVLADLFRYQVLDQGSVGDLENSAGTPVQFRVCNGQVVTPAMFAASGGGADDTIALTKMAAFANNFADYLGGIRIDQDHKTTKTIEFTKPDLRIFGDGKIVKAGAFSGDNPSNTDNFEAGAIVTLAGDRQHLSGITISDEYAVDGATNGYGRAVAIVADDVSVDGIELVNIVNGIEVAWSDTGFAPAGNYSGREVRGAMIIRNKISCRPHHENQEAVGSGIRSFGSRNYICGNFVFADDSHGPGLKLLHGIKIEALGDRRPSDPDLNDDGGLIFGNSVVGPFQHGIYVEAVSRTAVTLNTVRKPGRDGIKISASNVICTSNIADIGGYQDANPAAGIYVFAGKNIVVEGNVIMPWRNEAGSPTGHVGIYIGSHVGHSRFAGNILSRNASTVSEYTISGASGTIQIGTGGGFEISSGEGGDLFRSVASLDGTTLSVSQGSGWFEPGSTILQSTSGWTATVDAWVDPADVLIDYGIECKGINITIENNRFERGACGTCVQGRYGGHLTIRNNLFEGYRGRGINIQDYTDTLADESDLIIEGNNFTDALDATGEAVFIFSFTRLPDLILVKGNKFIRTAKALRFATGFSMAGTVAIVEGNTFIGNTTDLTGPRYGEVLYKNNVGLVNRREDQAETLSFGATSKVVSHGLVSTPKTVLITPAGDIGNWWVSDLGSTTFTLNCSTAPGSNVEFSWAAEIQQPAV